MPPRVRHAALLVLMLIPMFPLASAFGAGPVPAERAEGGFAELRGLVGPAAGVLTTAHFVVGYDAPKETVQRLASRFEATYVSVEKFCRVNDVEFRAPQALLEVLLFDRPEDFYAYAATIGVQARGLIGFHHTAGNRSAFFNLWNHPGLTEYHRAIERLEAQLADLQARELTSAQRAEKEAVLKQLRLQQNLRDRFVEQLNRTTVQHEVVHHLLYEAGVHVRGARTPFWLVEGLACLFETPPSRHGSGVGQTNPMRLADFRAACGEELDLTRPRPSGMKPEQLQAAYAAGRFVPLRQFIGLHSLSEGFGDSSAAYGYAQAWGLTLFLQRTYREKLGPFIAQTARRVPGQPLTPEQELAAFEAVFGPVDEGFERRWATFVFNLPFRPDRQLGQRIQN